MKKILSLVLVLALAIMPMLSFAIPDTITPEIGVMDGANPLLAKALGALTWIGYGIALIMAMWLGIQWLLATPAKKAELKGKLWSMAIGIVLLVAGSTIIRFFWGLAEDVQL